MHLGHLRRKHDTNQYSCPYAIFNGGVSDGKHTVPMPPRRRAGNFAARIRECCGFPCSTQMDTESTAVTRPEHHLAQHWHRSACWREHHTHFVSDMGTRILSFALRCEGNADIPRTTITGDPARCLLAPDHVPAGEMSRASRLVL